MHAHGAQICVQTNAHTHTIKINRISKQIHKKELKRILFAILESVGTSNKVSAAVSQPGRQLPKAFTTLCITLFTVNVVKGATLEIKVDIPRHTQPNTS